MFIAIDFQHTVLTGRSLADLAVEVDIARNYFSGTISLNSAFDPKGQRMRTFPKE